MLPEFVTKEWLSERLATNVLSFEAGTLGAGYMSDVFRLSIKRTDGEHTSVILKLESSDNESKAIALRFGAYDKEASFYQHINQQRTPSHFRVPSCYGVTDEPWSIILEDLDDLDTVAIETGASQTQTFAIASALAELHAITPPTTAMTLPAAIQHAASDMSGFVTEQIARFPASETRALALHYTKQSLDYVHLFSGPSVFSHMDCRWENMRFNGETPVIFDWGEHGLAPPGFDLAYFMMTSVTASNRKAWEVKVLNQFAEELPEYRRSQLFDNYRLAFLPGLYLSGLILHNGNEALGNLMMNRALDAVADHQAWLTTQLDR